MTAVLPMVPGEPFRPVPGWVIAGGRTAAALGGHLSGFSYSGGFQGDVFTAEANYKPAGPTGPVDPIVASKGRGQKLFIANCAQCHQASGLGVAGQFPPLVGSEWVIGPAPKRLPQILLHGIQGVIHVKGAALQQCHARVGQQCSRTTRSPTSSPTCAANWAATPPAPSPRRKWTTPASQTGSPRGAMERRRISRRFPLVPIEGGGSPRRRRDAVPPEPRRRPLPITPASATGAEKPAVRARRARGPNPSAAPTPKP